MESFVEIYNLGIQSKGKGEILNSPIWKQEERHKKGYKSNH